MRHAAIAVDGILRDPVTGQPDDAGRHLYHAMANNYRLTLLGDTTDTVTGDWLTIEGFNRHASVIPPGTDPDPAERRLQQIRTLRARGHVDIVVTPDPQLIPTLYGLGQSCLLYVNPRSLATLPALQIWQDLAARVDETRARAAQALAREEE